MASTKAADNPFTYRGCYYDKDLNLYYLVARYYDSKIARFVTPEPNLYRNGFDIMLLKVGWLN